MAIVKINSENSEYNSVEIKYNFNKDNKIFNTGDFIKDWYDSIKFRISLDKLEFDFNDDPSVNEFTRGSFDRRSLRMKDGEYYLTDGINMDYDFRAITYYVEEGTTPTWEELREICDDKKKEKK